MQRMTKRLKELVWTIFCEGIDHPNVHEYYRLTYGVGYSKGRDRLLYRMDEEQVGGLSMTDNYPDNMDWESMTITLKESMRKTRRNKHEGKIHRSKK